MCHMDLGFGIWDMKTRWRVLFVGLVLAALTSRGAETGTNRVDLTGVIQGKSGQPIEGATAFIYTAGPKLGVGFL